MPGIGCTVTYSNRKGLKLFGLDETDLKNGTNVFEIWHRVNVVASTIFFDSLSDWGNLFESGYVFSQTPGSATVTFGEGGGTGKSKKLSYAT